MITVRNRERFNDLFWGPWAELDRFQREVDQLFFGNGALHYTEPGGVPANLFADENGAKVQLSVPGYSSDALDLSIEGSTLIVRGTTDVDAKDAGRREFSASRFERRIELPFVVDPDQVGASLRDGILEVELPRAEADKPHTITIQS